jgi:hypothetical protein
LIQRKARRREQAQKDMALEKRSVFHEGRQP